MGFKFSMTGAALALSLLLGGCFDKSAEEQQAALKAKTEQFDKTVDAIQDPKLKEAVRNLGGSLLMLDRVRVEMDVHDFYSEPITLEAYQRTDVSSVRYPFKIKLDTPDAASLEQLQQAGAGSEDE